MSATDVSGHIVMVAGAASGIGKEIATRLIQRGAIVAACDRNFSALSELKKSNGSTNLHIYELDFIDDQSISATVSKIESDLGPLKAAVNCVGILGQRGDKAEAIDMEDFDYVYKVNLRGALFFTKVIIKGMAERGYGRILHLSSISGKEGNPLLVAYSATKAGLIGMVKSIGKEYATSGVTVNAMAPALIQSPMTDSFSESQLDYLKSRIPMSRLGDVSEAAEMAIWIISPACSFTTGFAFDLSGGRATY